MIIGPARIQDSIDIERPPAEVFDFVTVPSNWPEWYPITRKVEMKRGAAGVPAQAGFEVWEHIRVLGLPFTFVWQFCRVDEASFVQYQGRARFWGGFASIHYFLTPKGDDGQATHFERTLEYVQTNPLTQLLDLLVVRRIFRRASSNGLATIKRALEARPRL